MNQSTCLGLTRSSICALAGGKTQTAGIECGGLNLGLVARLCGCRVHGLGVLDGFLVGADFNRRAYWNEFVNLLDLRVGHSDAPRRPVHGSMQGTNPGPLLFDAVDFDQPSGTNALLARSCSISCVRIRDMQRKMETAVGVLCVDHILAFGRLPVSHLALRVFAS